MKIGIVGLPNVGKSTLFKALTKIQVDISNYPFCTIEPNVGIVEVPDERVDRLTDLSSSKKKIYATVQFVDIAGLVAGAAEGQGLGNKFLHNIREVDAIVQVVRLFENPNIIHVHGRIDPRGDIEVIDAELLLADLETVEKRLAKVEKEVRAGSKTAARQKEILLHLKELIDLSQTEEIRKYVALLEKDFQLIEDLNLLSFKPTLYVFNTDRPEEIGADLQRRDLRLPEEKVLALDIKTEEELLELSDEEKKELQIKSHLSGLIRKSYRLLGLINFLTTGPDETRSWTIPAFASAPRAGRAIHGDFEQRFICAEVVAYEDLLTAGTFARAKELGKVRTEGKSYIVQDGDVIEFRI